MQGEYVIEFRDTFRFNLMYARIDSEVDYGMMPEPLGFYRSGFIGLPRYCRWIQPSNKLLSEWNEPLVALCKSEISISWIETGFRVSLRG